MSTTLEQLRPLTTIVADTGDIEQITHFRPQDATTNPSLILKSAMDVRFAPLVDEVLAKAGNTLTTAPQTVVDELLSALAAKIISIIPGRVSVEVCPAWSFDTGKTLAHAERLIHLLTQKGVAKERVLIKIAATWEGIRAAEILERRGIHCNLTLLFSFAQAVACAEAGVQLISPFVGRIYDWQCKNEGVSDVPIEHDQGVASVRRIYTYYKKHGYATEIMGASFRKTAQILALAGCDLMTISPELLAHLHNQTETVEQKLSPPMAHQKGEEKTTLPHADFLFTHNASPMAVEKLAEGIRKFHDDTQKLYAFLQSRAR
jgi:transaldolase